MTKEISKLVIPNKKINYFTISIIFLGFICGCIFLIMLKNEDKTNVINQISNYFIEIKNNKLNNGLALKNNLIINYVYLFSIWILGFSVIGIILNIFIIYIKGFVIGFTISSMILTYNIKGLISSFIYLLFSQIFSMLIIVIIGIYSIMFSIHLLKLIFEKKKNNGRNMLKKYIIILIFCLIATFIFSLIESYIFPKIIKVIISLFVE